ncbi:hypothetical protein [Actinophytocola sp.]|uniref:hypothetical protein n=1 Tax=Actinophytocola sp. TaxID=1872138 RepID=UPI003899B018
MVGDVVVGADGVNSAVRRRYLPHARVVDTGVWQVYGAVPLTARTRPLFDDLRGMTGGDLHALVTSAVESWHPVREGAVNGQRFLGQDPLPVS